jgi:hypothetical protein
VPQGSSSVPVRARPRVQSELRPIHPQSLSRWGHDGGRQTELNVRVGQYGTALAHNSAAHIEHCDTPPSSFSTHTTVLILLLRANTQGAHTHKARTPTQRAHPHRVHTHTHTVHTHTAVHTHTHSAHTHSAHTHTVQRAQPAQRTHSLRPAYPVQRTHPVQCTHYAQHAHPVQRAYSLTVTQCV